MRRILVFLCWLQLALPVMAVEFAAPRKVDERRAASAGLRKVVGQHLRLYTDLPPSDAVDELPVVFDAAVPLWAEYFQVDVAQLRNWRMQGFLIEDPAKFAALGLMPKARPKIPNGFCNGSELWLMNQPSDYYRRHLLLHEGTHGFMAAFANSVGQPSGTGPGWYMEGMAELFGTHRWSDGRLEMRVMPAQKEEVPMWGRIKLVREANATKEALELSAVMSLDKRRAFNTTEYSWCWALCYFLDSHPRWEPRFRELFLRVGEPNFNQRFRRDLRDDWRKLLVEWRAFVAELDYGYDSGRMEMRHLAGVPVGDGASVVVDAERGWQSTGWLVEAKQKVQVTAEGRYQIAEEPIEEETRDAEQARPWPCEPGGVTLECHEGRPLGMLLGAWRFVANDRFSEPVGIGLQGELQPAEDAVLYLRVNDSPSRLSDNRGTLSASIRRVDD